MTWQAATGTVWQAPLTVPWPYDSLFLPRFPLPQGGTGSRTSAAAACGMNNKGPCRLLHLSAAAGAPAVVSATSVTMPAALVEVVAAQVQSADSSNRSGSGTGSGTGWGSNSSGTGCGTGWDSSSGGTGCGSSSDTGTAATLAAAAALARAAVA